MEYIKVMFDYIINQFMSMNFFDVMDIIIVSVILYYTYKFVRDRRAGRLALGVLVVIMLMVVSSVLNMQALNFLIEKVLQAGIIGLVILFQSELRSFLEKMGGTSFIGKKKKDGMYISGTVKCIDAVADAVFDFSESKTGALVVFERTTKLGDVIKTGTIIDAAPSAYIMKNIFFNKAPLHDGALIVRNNRFYSAGCFLPLSMNNDIIKDLGTRHRAAIGMSENSDAIVAVVSEETGIVSIACDGHLTRDYDKNTFKKTIKGYFLSDKENSGTSGISEKAKGGSQ